MKERRGGGVTNYFVDKRGPQNVIKSMHVALSMGIRLLTLIIYRYPSLVSTVVSGILFAHFSTVEYLFYFNLFK